MSIRIVTDSTCDLPEAVVSKYGITVVPDYINLDGQSYLDGVELSRQEFYQRLPDCESPPTTSAPPPAVFAREYERLAAEGATEVLSVHVPEYWSNLLSVARIAARETDCVRVTVFDSRQLSLGTGFMIIKAAKAVSDGCCMSEVVAILEEMIPRVHVLALLDTLEFLRRSGRVSRLQASMGGLLSIKPLMHVHRGEISMERLRTRRRGVDRLLRCLSDFGPLEGLGLLHTNAHNRVAALRREVHRLLPRVDAQISLEATPVIGVHIGPGAVGVACVSAQSR